MSLLFACSPAQLREMAGRDNPAESDVHRSRMLRRRQRATNTLGPMTMAQIDPPMDSDKWRAFTFDFLRAHMSRMYDDVSPKEVVDWLLWSWHFDKERMSKDEVLRHCLEHIVAELKSQLPTWANARGARHGQKSLRVRAQGYAEAARRRHLPRIDG